MGMVNTVGLVLHPARDCNSALFELLAWASKRKVTVLALEEEASRVPGPVEAVAPADLAARSDLMVSLGGLLSSVHEYARSVATPVQTARVRPRKHGQVSEASHGAPQPG